MRGKMKWWEAKEPKTALPVPRKFYLVVPLRNGKEQLPKRQLGNSSYVRFFVCPFCGEQTAYEAYRDSLRRGKTQPEVEFWCPHCHRYFKRTVKGFIRDMAPPAKPGSRKAQVAQQTIDGRVTWHRTDSGGGEPDSEADYQTLTQAIMASGKRHVALATMQAKLEVGLFNSQRANP